MLLLSIYLSLGRFKLKATAHAKERLVDAWDATVVAWTRLRSWDSPSLSLLILALWCVPQS